MQAGVEQVVYQHREALLPGPHLGIRRPVPHHVRILTGEAAGQRPGDGLRGEGRH